MSGHTPWSQIKHKRDARKKDRRLFLRWLLLQALTVAVFVPAAAYYHGDLHPAAIAATGAVLSVFVAATLYAGYLAWKARQKGLEHVSLAATILPMMGLLGSVCGFLIAFSGDMTDVQARVLGASTSLVSTFTAVSCTILLLIQAHLIETG